MILKINNPLPKREFLKKIYNGEIICFENFEAINNINRKSKQIIGKLINPFDPEKIHKKSSHKKILSIILEFQKIFRNSSYISNEITKFFHLLGFSSNELFLDRIYARVVSSNEKKNNFIGKYITDPLSFHRDTWGSNLYSQINWWSPIFKLQYENTMIIFPQFWDVPLKNDSKNFNLPEVINLNKNLILNGKKQMKSIPTLRQKVDLGSGIPILIKPGEILAFSGAHAHSSMSNNSGFTRYSFETRTIFFPDFLNSVGAKNIDGASKWMAPGWFKRISDKKKLSEVINSDAICKLIK